MSDEDLRQNPVLLYNMIEHLNYIRSYYLNHLTKEISHELAHAAEEIKWDQFPEHSLRMEAMDDISNVVNRFYLWGLNTTDFIKARHYFGDYKWSGFYGGARWEEITEWTQKLWAAGEIPQQRYNEELFVKIADVVFIIDTIHSLQHNRNLILEDLPHGEREWLDVALEIVKHSKSSWHIMDKMSDMELKKQLFRNRMVAQEGGERISSYGSIFGDWFDKTREAMESGDFSLPGFGFIGKLIKKADSNDIDAFLDTLEDNLDILINNSQLLYRHLLYCLIENTNFYKKDFIINIFYIVMGINKEEFWRELLILFSHSRKPNELKQLKAALEVIMADGSLNSFYQSGISRLLGTVNQYLELSNTNG